MYSQILVICKKNICWFGDAQNSELKRKLEQLQKQTASKQEEIQHMQTKHQQTTVSL